MFVFAVLAGAVAMTVPAASASAATPRWAVVQGPVLGAGNNGLASVSCPAVKSCMAVGITTLSGGATGTLAEAWNGTSWSVVSSPNVANSTASQLTSVSCLGSTDCMAVGNTLGVAAGEEQTLAEVWDGTSWSIVSTPATAASIATLNGVSCVSATDCVAVGFTATTTGTVAALIEAWNGSVWSIVNSPVVKMYRIELSGVSCVSAVSCVAVGEGRIHAPIIESWNGKAWKILSPTSSTTNSNLAGLSCQSVTSCVAVGYRSGGRSLVESWNGKTWSLVSSPNRSTSTNLDGVSCLSATSCFAVGVGGAVPATTVETWNGSKWSLVKSPSPGTYGSLLDSVSCVGSSCVAVGFTYTDVNGSTAQPLIEAN